MGKTFRRDSGHNKFNKRDRGARDKFSRKFQNLKRGKIQNPVVDEIINEIIPIDDYDNN